MKSFALLALAATVVGCAGLPNSLPQAPVRVEVPFDEADAQARLRPGTAKVRGSALVRQQGGGVVTCAGSEVTLSPATAYARSRLAYLYGPTTRGYLGAYTPKKVFEPDPPGYYSNVRKATCDAQGFFEFNGLASGDYFVTLSVMWRVGYTTQGGHLMQKVTLADGGSESIVLTP